MNFKNKLISGVFIKRYKRFLVDIKIKKKLVTAHCPNTGSMKGLLKAGNKVWLTKSTNPKRKLKYTLEIIEDGGKKVGVNTHSANKIVLDALENNRFKEFDSNYIIKREVKFGSNTRFDFLIKKSSYKAFLEVKSVTLSRKNRIAEFPDAVTERGAKHIQELLKASKEGFKIFLVYIIQRNDCKKFSIASDIDPNYWKLLSKAIKKKLKIICYDCKFSTKGIKVNKKIKIKF